MYIVDRFGQSYYSIGAYPTLGAPAGGAYMEGYITEPIQSGTEHLNRMLPTPSELSGKIAGGNICFGISGSFVVGGGSSVCLNKSFASVISVGVQGGVSGLFNPSYTRLGSRRENQGWNWANEDRSHGVMRQDLLGMFGVPYDGCDDYLPLSIR